MFGKSVNDTAYLNVNEHGREGRGGGENGTRHESRCGGMNGTRNGTRHEWHTNGMNGTQMAHGMSLAVGCGARYTGGGIAGCAMHAFPPPDLLADKSRVTRA